jgi:hypothetical protein
MHDFNEVIMLNCGGIELLSLLTDALQNYFVELVCGQHVLYGYWTTWRLDCYFIKAFELSKQTF